MEIKQLFDPSKDIYRSIEKVIAYGVSQEERLKREITEYVVTDSIDEQFNKLLLKMQAAMDAGGENEVGVWVSGFYGSGKSSLTKYLGLAFDDSVNDMHDVRPFAERGKAPRVFGRHFARTHGLIKVQHHVLERIRPAFAMAAGKMRLPGDVAV